MPQMAPLNWLTLMLYFLMILLSFNALNYYYYFNKKMKNIKMLASSPINWKW
uniref:ATP synthase complex subunit 8 n=1 Tax=Mordellidae sp. 4 ACP-2013 TaxID=1434549 RepID=A0A3G3MET5_9CUCU|nr:ATP synthase F0 subunit 8 [Mordellidae sp. 4 ACP-2013]